MYKRTRLRNTVTYNNQLISEYPRTCMQILDLSDKRACDIEITIRETLKNH